MASTAPPLPRRPEQAIPPADDIPDEPPPAYEPTPSANEQPLEYGPTRPFQPPLGPPPSSSRPPPPALPARTSYAPPLSHRPPPVGSVSPQPTGGAGGSGLAPPQFPFWNGAGLTPQQTGFSEGPIAHPNHYTGSPSPYASPPPPPPHHPSSSSSAPQIPPLQILPNPSLLADDPASLYAPTTQPTPGQAYLNEGRLLVYPVGSKPCPKCSNTGYKPFDPYTGYRGDDPSHPCRQCWKKHSRPFSPPLSTSCTGSTHETIPSNYQKPLRLLQTPSTRPRVSVVGVGGNGGGFFGGGGLRGGFGGGGGGMGGPNANAIVVRPGDPRIGGVLCRRCGGDGLEMGPFLFDSVTCSMCAGAGRVFP